MSVETAQLSVRAEERIGVTMGGDLQQPPTARAVRPHGKATPIVIGQLQASAPLSQQKLHPHCR
jgi:hypothetical protein